MWESILSVGMLPSPDCDAICLIYSFCLPEAGWACLCVYVCFHMCTILWHYPQKYTVVWWQGALCLGVMLHMNSHTVPVCAPPPAGLTLSYVHLSFSSKSPAPEVDLPSTTFARKCSDTQIYCSTPRIQFRSDMLMFLTQAQSSLLSSRLCGVRTSWDVTTFIRSASAGGLPGPLCRGWQMHQPA